MLEMYYKLIPFLNEAPYTRPVRTVVREAHLSLYAVRPSTRLVAVLFCHADLVSFVCQLLQVSKCSFQKLNGYSSNDNTTCKLSKSMPPVSESKY